ncbi:LCP family protein [Candidatus Leptofilum sp.]|uniref:LCP family protein n=1 Tax=Candidatus Leptofilum sp. TaxID=3241576 RepID=UPI003B5D0171
MKQQTVWFYLVTLFLLGAACQTSATSPLPTPVAAIILPTETSASPLLPATAVLTATSMTPSPESRPSATAVLPTTTPTAAATATIRPYPTLDYAVATPATAVPSPVPPFPKPAHITNIVLLGNDVKYAQGGRTDSIIIVSINRQTKTAVLLTVPRDLYIVIPGWKMTRINLALPHGHGANYPGGGGGLIKDSIEYNLGIPIDYYARIGFDGFRQVVDALGGVEIINNCPLTDWRLSAPDLNPELEESWEQFTLEPGIHQMDGDLALWYARSRRTTNDFERGQRQQQLLRAIFNQGLRLELLPELPQLWQTYQETIETDMTLPLLLELAALAPAIQENGIQHLVLAGESVQAWREPGSGAAVQLLQWEEASAILARVMQPPTLSRANRPPLRVEVVTDDAIMYRQMAHNLAWYGFAPSWSQPTESLPAHTRIEYFAPNRKESYDWLLSWLFHQQPDDIVLMPTAEQSNIYRVTLGTDANPCLSQLEAPLGAND